MDKTNSVSSSSGGLILDVPEGLAVGPVSFNISLNGLQFFLRDVHWSLTSNITDSYST